MASLYWRRRKGRVKPVELAPYSSEQEFEQDVFQTPELLEDVFLLKRQVRGGGKSGIPDIIGIDEDGKVCIIEMKNSPIDAAVIPQILEYAIWAESNPDSIKSLWLEAQNRPEDRAIDWDNLEVRVLVVAPSIDRATLEHVNKINYQVELIEIARWMSGRDSWLLVNRLEPLPIKKKRPVSGLIIYDRAVYEQRHKPEAVRAFLQVCDDLQSVATKRNWPVERKFNKHYCGFKVGNYIVFGVKWISGKSFGIFLKIPEAAMRRAKIPGFESKYESLWNQAVYRPTGPSFSVAKMKLLLEKALEARVD
ncbi:MAG: hypothetical protein HOP35_04830 [Nitrospira sp.]|nr:hypothetical protein [Nitrospira sp.]